MRFLLSLYGLYAVISAATVLLAFTEACLHMCLYGFLAIFACQPWLAVGWVLSGMGLVTLGDLTPVLVAMFCALNLILGAGLLLIARRVVDAKPKV